MTEILDKTSVFCHKKRDRAPGGGGGGGTHIYGLYRYVPRDRVWFLRFSVLK